MGTRQSIGRHMATASPSRPAVVGDQGAVGDPAQALRHQPVAPADRDVADVLAAAGDAEVTEPSLQGQLQIATSGFFYDRRGAAPTR